MGVQSARENMAPVPHAPSSSLGALQTSRKKMEKNFRRDVMLLTGKILLLVVAPLLLVSVVGVALSNEDFEDLFTLDFFLQPGVHAMVFFLLGMMMYMCMFVSINTFIQKVKYKDLVYPSPVPRKHIILFSMLITEIILVLSVFFLSIAIAIIFWGHVRQPLVFLFFLFFSIYLTVRIISIFFIIIKQSSELPKTQVQSWVLNGSIMIFMIAMFLPMLIFTYNYLSTDSFTSNWVILKEDPLAKIIMMLPNSILVAVSEDVSIWIRSLVILLLLGINIFMSAIEYVMLWTTDEVTWKHGHTFHKVAKRRKDFKAEHEKPKLSLGWDPKEAKGLKAMDRIPMRIFQRNRRSIETGFVTFTIVLMILFILVGLGPVFALYVLFLFPILICSSMIIIWSIVSKGEGLKFLRLFPNTPKEISHFLTMLIEGRCLAIAILIPFIAYLPIWLMSTILVVDLFKIGVGIICLFLALVIFSYFFMIVRIKNAASSIKGHFLALVMPTSYAPKKGSSFMYELKETLAAGLFVSSLIFMMILTMMVTLIFYISRNPLVWVFNILLVVSLYYFMRNSFRHNLLAFLSNNRIHLKTEERWLPFITLISSIVGLILYLFIPFFSLIYLD
jgi:hypothetical protein